MKNGFSVSFPFSPCLICGTLDHVQRDTMGMFMKNRLISIALSATVGVAYATMAAVPALAALPAAPYQADLETLKTWIMVICGFIFFAALIVLASCVISKRYGEAAMAFAACVIFGAIVLNAQTIATGLTGA